MAAPLTQDGDLMVCSKCHEQKPKSCFYLNLKHRQCKDCLKATQNTYNAQRGEVHKAIKRSYRRKQRDKILEFFGNKCRICGFSDKRALQIDHVNGGGNQEKLTKGSYQIWRNYKGLLNGTLDKNCFQLLCANCNSIKRFKQGEGVSLNRYESPIQA